MFFIALIYWSAPAYGVLARLFEARGGMVMNSADPMVADMAVLSAARYSGLPSWCIRLLAAGGMSAAFSTVAGLLMTGSASFSYDIYPRLIKPNASETDKVYAAKGIFLALAVIILALSLRPWGMIAEIAALAFALAGNTIFPAFLLGIWWDRANAAGVISGMLAGVVITFVPFLAGALPFLSALPPATSSAFIGAPLVIVIMVAVSLLTPPPDDEIRRFLARNVHDVAEE